MRGRWRGGGCNVCMHVVVVVNTSIKWRDGVAGKLVTQVTIHACCGGCRCEREVERSWLF